MLLNLVRFESKFAAALALGLSGLLSGGAIERAAAQSPSIMAPGDTIISAFSGTVAPTPPFPSGDPVDETFINLDGLSMQIQRPQPPAPPAGQLIPAPTVFSVPARTIGQVFAITLDDQPVPNIYLGASSTYGLQIVAPDNDGDGRPERLKSGQPDATFMDGQWGAGGSPGSIYRVDGTTGAVTLFSTIGANAGPGLGDVVFDKATHQLFASDLDTGLIYRLDWTGAIIDTFDHGVNGRPTHGLPAVADDGSTMNITDPSFNAEDPTTWGYTQKERMVWGMAVHSGRLYYAAGDGPSIWSVGINLDGTFGTARWELDVTGLASTNMVSDIVFDGSGRMILAQRGAQVGSYDYTVFADPLQSSVVRYQREIPDDPTTPSVWVQVPDEYAIGFRPEERNTTGGIALGYGYGTDGKLRKGACFQYLWTTGDSLRDNPALALGEPATVHGLQGNDADLVKPQNDPPYASYFTDYDNQYDDPQNQGHMGDVEIWQPCDAYTPPYFPPPTYNPGTFNLTLDKRAFDCIPYHDGWFCFFTVRVSNTGTTAYWGPLSVEDWLPVVPAGAVMNFAPQPPWLCGPLGPGDYQCNYPPVYLLPGDGVDLYVGVQLPPRYQPCSLDNGARIVWPLGFGDANPADDYDFASAHIPSKQCEPPPTPKTNLKIFKYPYPKVCTDTGTDWVCKWVVQIMNTGPGIFNQPISITETLSSGTPIAVSAPWSCVPAGPDFTCSRPAISLNPTASTFLVVTTSISKAKQYEAGQCSITNKVKIASPLGSPWNSIAVDDSASAEDLTPGRNCEPIGKRSDLSIKKEAKGCISYNFNDRKVWLCGYTITVRNEGPDAFFAPVSVHDQMTPAPLPPSPWFLPSVCVPGGGGYDCNSGVPVFIAPHTSLAPVGVLVAIPDDGVTCQISNKATITAPLGGTLNTVAGNDSSTAVLNIPSPKCQNTVILKDEKTCDPGSIMLGSGCCPLNSVQPGGACCPNNARWNGKSCGETTAPSCPPNTTGIYPDCKPTTEKPKRKPVPKTCDPGFTGKYPNCVKTETPTCGEGFTGKYPNCRPIVKQTCGDGYTGKFPNCILIVKECPANTRGTYPNCVAIETPHCLSGFIGKFPNCVRAPSTTGPAIQTLPLTNVPANNNNPKPVP